MTIKSTTKVYLEIVERLRDMIAADGLCPGDRIPSERELSERLGFGRSSVREALRALELLGLIETRRGEGTFIKDFQEHQLVELLGTFILQDQKVLEDAQTCKVMIEKSCIELLYLKGKNELVAKQIDDKATIDEIMPKIVENADNRLLTKIWKILSEYVPNNQPEQSNREMHSFVHSFLNSNEEETLGIFKNMHKLSK